MEQPLLELLRLLGDGEAHTGARLGEQLGISRQAVWKRIERLRELGLPVIGSATAGYRLDPPPELLDRDRILSRLNCDQREVLNRLEIVLSTDSTNDALAALPLDSRHGSVLLAEHQRAGRGRRGRQWHSPLAANLYLSLAWRFDRGIAALGGLSLAVAVAAARALQQQGVGPVHLKWPNDILLDERKLGGILVEVSGDLQGPCHVIVGIGLNYRMPDATRLDQPWTDLRDHALSRNALAAALLNHLLAAMADYADQGFSTFARDWYQWDCLRGRQITVIREPSPVEGVAMGVADDGALLLHSDGQQMAFHAGEVSVRASR